MEVLIVERKTMPNFVFGWFPTTLVGFICLQIAPTSLNLKRAQTSWTLQSNFHNS
jgi:hypothetical protein